MQWLDGYGALQAVAEDGIGAERQNRRDAGELETNPLHWIKTERRYEEQQPSPPHIARTPQRKLTGSRPWKTNQRTPTMTADKFVKTLKRLGYTPHNAQQVLGISRSTIFRIVNGTSEVPPVVEKLLAMYERFGIPEEHKQ